MVVLGGLQEDPEQRVGPRAGAGRQHCLIQVFLGLQGQHHLKKLQQHLSFRINLAAGTKFFQDLLFLHSVYLCTHLSIYLCIHLRIYPSVSAALTVALPLSP